MTHEFQTPIVKPVSLEAAATNRYLFAKAQAEQAVIEADHNLARIAMIYSGKLTLDALRDDIAPSFPINPGW